MTINIRCSMLPSYPDCPRRAAVKQYRSTIIDMGYELRELPRGVGASIGSGYHAAVKLAMETKRDSGKSANVNDAIENGILEFKKNTENGVMWDTVTNNSNTAEKQIQQLTRVFYDQAENCINPVNVETKRKVIPADGFELTGSSDTETETEILDWKSGVKMRPCHAQLGGYRLMQRSTGAKPVTKLSQYYNPRVSLKKAHPGITVYSYDPRVCEAEAAQTIKRIMFDVNKFLETQNPISFAANPMSMMCNDRFCPAWGTKFCNICC